MKHWGGSEVDSTNLISYFALFEDFANFHGLSANSKKTAQVSQSTILADATSASRQTSEGAHILISISWAELLTW